MTAHLSEVHRLGLLHGNLAEPERTEAKAHVRDCPECARALTQDAQLDEVLWEARRAQPVSALALAVPQRRLAPPRRAPRRFATAAWLGAGACAVAAVATWGAGAAARTQGAATSVLDWQNVVFYISLAAGLLLVLVSMLGGHGHSDAHVEAHVEVHVDGHVEPHADTGAGADHHGLAGEVPGGGSSLGRIFSLLGIGKVPLSIVLMVASLVFGGAGVIANIIFSSAGLAPGLYGPISIAIALAVVLGVTGPAARLLHRVMPASETYRVSRHDFAGCTGKLLLPADATSGYAQVKDFEGNVHNVQCRAIKDPLPKGAPILIVAYDEKTQTFLVEAHQA
jgi:hypothetical protein